MILEQKIIEKFFYKKYYLLITLAFFLITSYVAFFHHNYWTFDEDGIAYLHAGEEILRGNGKNIKLYDAPVGGPVIYASLNYVLNDGFISMKIIALVSSTAAVFFSYKLLRNIFEKKTALVGQLFFAFNPWFIFYSIQAENEMLPVFLVITSLYIITKKQLKFFDIAVAGTLIGLAFMIRSTAIVIIITIIIFLLINTKHIHKNLLYNGILIACFLIVITPLIFFNYFTYGSIFDHDPSFYMQYSYKFTNPTWKEQILQNAMNSDGTIKGIFLDFDLFQKNYFYNLFYNNPSRFFNFYEKTNTSLIPAIPILGMIPILGGIIYLFNIQKNKINLLAIILSFFSSLILIFFLGDIRIHFFALIIIPLVTLGIINIKNIQKNLIPLMILPIIFTIITSIAQLEFGEQFFMMWISIAVFSAVFFTKVVYSIFQQKHLQSNTKQKFIKIILITLVSLILFVNLGYAYVLVRSNSSGVPFSSIQDEIRFLQNGPIEKEGIEIKHIGDILSNQPGIENSYIMAPQLSYFPYVKGKLLFANFDEGPVNDTINNFITRKNWKEIEIFHSNIHSFPMDRLNLYKPIPDYVIYDPRGKQAENHHEYLKILADPNNPAVPSNFEVIYQSSTTGIIVYKINHN